MPFKMMGKSPLMKKLIGNQSRLPENLKAAIKAAPGKMVSPLKETEYQKTLKAARAAGMTQFEYNKKMKAESEKKARLKKEAKMAAAEASVGGGWSTTTSRESDGEGSGKTGGGSSTTTSSNQDRFAKAYAKRGKEYQNMSLSEYTAEAKKQIANRKKTGKYIGGEKKSEVTTPKPPKVGPTLSGTSSVMGDKIGGTKGFSTVKVGGSGGAKATFGKKVVNRPGGTFTDEFGNTYNRSVKGRKKSDGSVSKTITNKRNDAITSQKDVTKGPKVNGRRTKTVTKTKFTGSGTPRVVVKTRGPGGRKRTVLGDTEAKAKVAELKKRREERDNSPTKMKTKTPNKMMKKKKSPTMMMKKKKSPTMMMKKKSSMKMMKKKK